MKKILAICTSPDRGGLELYFISLVKYFSNQSHIFTACRRNSHISKKIQSNRILIKKNNIFNLLINIVTLLQYIKNNKIDIIHVSWTKDLLLSSVLKKLSHRKLSIIYYRQMKITRPKKDLFHKFIYKEVDIVLTITENLKRECTNFLPIAEENIVVLKYGIQSRNTSGSSKENIFTKYNLDLSKYTIGIFSRIEEQKGQHLAIEALNLLYEKNIQLLIIGHCMDDDYKSNLEKKCDQYGLIDRVKFIPFIDKPSEIMSVIDLVILPTYEETFGLVVAESMMMQTPVIGSDAGGVPEIINDRHNGLLFKTKDSSSLAEKIYLLYGSSDLRNKIVKNAELFVRKEYDYDNHFRNFEEIIKRVT